MAGVGLENMRRRVLGVKGERWIGVIVGGEEVFSENVVLRI